MTLRMVHGRPTAEDVADAEAWLQELTDCPPVTSTVVTVCTNDVHGDDQPSWFYVEADANEGVCRLRCLGCAGVRHLLDSEERWNFPPMWSCVNCEQSIAEVVVGAHDEAEGPTWVAVAARCVECGTVHGLTDAVVSAPHLQLAGAL